MPPGLLGVEIRNAAFRDFFQVFRAVQRKLAAGVFPFLGAVIDEGGDGGFTQSEIVCEGRKFDACVRAIATLP